MLNDNCLSVYTQCTWETKENNKDLSCIRTNTHIQDRIHRTVEVNKHTDTVTKTHLDLSIEKPCLPLCKQSLLQSYAILEDNFALIMYFILPNLHFVHFIYIFNVKMGFLVVATGSCNLTKRRKLLAAWSDTKTFWCNFYKALEEHSILLPAVTSVLMLKTFMQVNKHVD